MFKVNFLTLLLIQLLTATGAFAANADVRADMLTIKFTSAIKASKYAEALPAMAELETLGTPLSEDFYFLYLDTLDQAGENATALNRSYAYIDKFGRGGKYYGRVIEIATRLQDLADRDAKVAAEAKAKAAAEASRREKDLWQKAQASENPKVIEEYISQNSNSTYLSSAKEMLASIRSSQAEFAQGKVIKDCADCPEMVMISPGAFTMGLTMGGEKPTSAWTPHNVTIAKSFALAKTEVTKAQWRAVMGTDSSRWGDCNDDNCPADGVGWKDAKEYLRRLSLKTGKTYRLPSEAEWEYACRAGAQHEYCGSDTRDAVASYRKSFPSAVATKQPNAWGLYDMTGNVAEWVEDCTLWGYELKIAPTDGSAFVPTDDSFCVRDERILRGGAYKDLPENLVAAARYSHSESFGGGGMEFARP
jgi:formylglycine-generating enzyme required for sulfatase activity